MSDTLRALVMKWRARSSITTFSEWDRGYVNAMDKCMTELESALATPTDAQRPPKAGDQVWGLDDAMPETGAYTDLDAVAREIALRLRECGVETSFPIAGEISPALRRHVAAAVAHGVARIVARIDGDLLHKVRVKAKAEYMGQDMNDLLAFLLREELTTLTEPGA